MLCRNLAWVGALLDRCPNFYIDISARLAELGRQPYTARRFFVRYADRILFGTIPARTWPPIGCTLAFSRPTTNISATAHPSRPTRAAGGSIGLFLPDDVLEKVYYRNAERVILRKRPR